MTDEQILAAILWWKADTKQGYVDAMDLLSRIEEEMERRCTIPSCDSSNPATGSHCVLGHGHSGLHQAAPGTPDAARDFAGVSEVLDREQKEARWGGRL